MSGVAHGATSPLDGSGEEEVFENQKENSKKKREKTTAEKSIYLMLTIS